jgi:hypothetical protein
MVEAAESNAGMLGWLASGVALRDDRDAMPADASLGFRFA